QASLPCTCFEHRRPHRARGLNSHPPRHFCPCREIGKPAVLKPRRQRALRVRLSPRTLFLSEHTGTKRTHWLELTHWGRLQASPPCTCLENRRPARARGLDSHPSRQHGHSRASQP